MSPKERNQRPRGSQSRPKGPTRRLNRPRSGPRWSAPSQDPAVERASNRRRTFETFAQSVSCLLSDDEPSQTDRQALVSLVRQSFPEYTRAKQSLTAAQERQKVQVEQLGPHLLTNASFLTEPDPDESEQSGIIDESARILWELGRIDEQIEALQQRINLLQHQIMTWIEWEEPSSTRVVRWALENA